MTGSLHIVMRGAGDLATGVALRLHRGGFRRLVMLERAFPMAVRRAASFAEAVRLGSHQVEGVTARLAASVDQAAGILADGAIPVLVDPSASSLDSLRPDVFVDAAMAKRNLGTSITDAPLVIGLGPGFWAGRDCHRVVETCRGHGLGRVLLSGQGLPDTGVPEAVMGFTRERVLRAPCGGVFETCLEIGQMVEAGQGVASVDDVPVVSAVSGVLRGILPSRTLVEAGAKVGDVDPRGDASACFLASDKALAVGGGVLEATLEHFNRPGRHRPQESPPWPSATP